MLSRQLKQLLFDKNISWQTCAELADIPLETMRNLYYGKVKDPKVSTLLSISHALNVSINRLLGENLFTDEEYALLKHFQNCGKHGKSLLLQIAQFEAHIATTERETLEKHRIPCIIPDSHVCDGSKYSSGKMKEVYTIARDAFLALEVPNNNWAPRFCKHDTLLLKSSFPKHREEALFTYNGNIYFRKYLETDQAYVLRCVNNRQEDLIFQRMDEPSLICIGTFVGIIRA